MKTIKRTLAVVLIIAALLCTSVVDYSAQIIENASQTTVAKATRIKKVSHLQITTAKKSKQLVLSWDAQDGVTGYQIFRSTTGKKESYKRIASTLKTKYTDKGLNNSTVYYYAVRAYIKKNGTTTHGPFTKTDLSTRITKAYARKRFINAFVVGAKWIADPDVWKKETYDFQIPADVCSALNISNDGGCCYVAVDHPKIHTKAKLKKYLSKYFEKSSVDEFVELFYLEKNGKLYHLHIDQGGFLGERVLNDTQTNHIAYGDYRCTVSYQVHDVYQYWYPEDDLKSVDTVHSDAWVNKLPNCFNGNIGIYHSCKVSGKIINKTIKAKQLVGDFSVIISDCHLRISPFEFSLSKCPNIAYRCDFTVVNSENKPIKNLDVLSGGPDLGNNYLYNVQNATDDSGVVSFFYPEDSYTAKFLLNGQVVATKSFTMIDTTKAITVKINTTATDGGGSGHNGGTGGSDYHMYNAAFDANGGKFSDGSATVSLYIKSGDPITPPADPTRDSYYFAGWAPDVPATMPSTNITFTATWSTTPPTGAADGTGSADDLSAGGTQGGTIKFGAYPQTRETDSETISALNSRASGWQSYEYYSGSGSWNDGQMQPSDYMQYCDVKYGGNKYRGVVFSQYRPSTGETFPASDSIQENNGYTTGTTYWFKYEPLQWKVLDPSEGLVMCVSIIDSQPYNNYILSGGTDPHGETAYWGDAGKTYYANDYENSSLRRWLNETFYATAFTTSQQNRIAVNRDQNNDGYRTLHGNTGYTDYDSNPTNDKIFLLSYDEVLNSSYGFDSWGYTHDMARKAHGTAYAYCQGLDIERGLFGYQFGSHWWLRSPGGNSVQACVVDGLDGTAYGSGNIVNFTCRGVRPACKISNLSSGISKSGNPNPKAAPAAKAAATGAGTYQKTDAGAFQYTATGCVAGQDYILLNVTGYGDDFTLTTSNLEYIDQVTADESGAVSGSFLPRQAVAGSTTLLIGDFGSGTEARQITVTEQTQPEEHQHTYTSAITTKPGCETPGVRTYTCTCGDTYTEPIPALGHTDEANDGYCDRCGQMMTGDDHCPQCGKIHNEPLIGWLIGLFHRIIYRLTHLFQPAA